MAENEELEPLRSDRWKEKTDFVPGLVFGETDIPEIRYQVLGPDVYVLQVWSDGSTGRGILTLDDLANQLGKPITKEGWYDWEGKYLGNDPGLE